MVLYDIVAVLTQLVVLSPPVAFVERVSQLQVISPSRHHELVQILLFGRIYVCPHIVRTCVVQVPEEAPFL